MYQVIEVSTGSGPGDAQRRRAYGRQPGADGARRQDAVPRQTAGLPSSHEAPSEGIFVIANITGGIWVAPAMEKCAKPFAVTGFARFAVAFPAPSDARIAL
jgi:hypothetical protein